MCVDVRSTHSAGLRDTVKRNCGSVEIFDRVMGLQFRLPEVR